MPDGDFLRDLPDPTALTDDELNAEIDERLREAAVIAEQLAAEREGLTDRGRHWRMRATTARAAIEAQARTLKAERLRRRARRHDAKRAAQQQHQERMAAEAAIRRQQKAAVNLAVRFQAAAKRALPAETYRRLLEEAQADA
jgi:hypothetical protein